MASISLFYSELKHLFWFQNAVYRIVIQLLYIIYTLIRMLQLPLQIVNTIWKAATFWPKLFWHLYGRSRKNDQFWISYVIRLIPPNNLSRTDVWGGKRNGKQRFTDINLAFFGCTFGAISAQPIHLANFFNDCDADGELTSNAACLQNPAEQKLCSNGITANTSFISGTLRLHNYLK